MDLKTSQLKNKIYDLLKESGINGSVVDKINARGELVIAVVLNEVCPTCNGDGKRKYPGGGDADGP